jgi:hypothetical protein
MGKENDRKTLIRQDREWYFRKHDEIMQWIRNGISNKKQFIK